MITMEWNGTLFQFRAAALIWSHGHLLIHRDTRVNFWALPGGRVEFGELAIEALQREMHEELNSATKVGPLRFVIESCGKTESGKLQEIGFYFDVQLENPPRFHENDIVYRCVDGEADLEYRWALPSPDILKRFDFRPDIISDKLQHRSDGVLHLAVHE